MERRRLRVYVAGPITKGGVNKNVRNGIEWGAQMLRDGLAPYIPHLNTFMFGNSASGQLNGLLEWDIEWVAVSDAVFRLPGESKGADIEVEKAREAGIPVFYNYPLLLEFAHGMRLTGKRPITVPRIGDLPQVAENEEVMA